jgi:hypothetical protein
MHSVSLVRIKYDIRQLRWSQINLGLCFHCGWHNQEVQALAERDKARILSLYTASDC